MKTKLAIGVLCVLTMAVLLQACPAVTGGTSFTMPNIQVGNSYTFHVFPGDSSSDRYTDRGQITSIGPGPWVTLEGGAQVNLMNVWRITPSS